MAGAAKAERLPVEANIMLAGTVCACQSNVAAHGFLTLTSSLGGYVFNL